LQGELEAVKGSAETNSNTHPILLQSQTSPAQAFRSQLDETKSPEEPTSFQYKGLTLTPGGFLEGTMLVRTRNDFGVPTLRNIFKDRHARTFLNARRNFNRRLNEIFWTPRGHTIDTSRPSRSHAIRPRSSILHR
jgi:hypothetical protein